MQQNRYKEPVKRTTIASVVQALPDDASKYHNLVSGNMKRICSFCKETGARFACGKVRSSSYRCEGCQLAFCRVTVSDCFYQWHKRLEGIDLSTFSCDQ